MNDSLRRKPRPRPGNIDPTHAAAEFKYKHRMISSAKGQFAKVTGLLALVALFAGLSVTRAQTGT